jgi:hypothetical protein
MKIKSDFVVVKPYSGSSKYDFLYKPQVGDVITLSIPLISPRRGSHGLHTTKVTMDCNGESFICTLSECVNYLSKMVIAEHG